MTASIVKIFDRTGSLLTEFQASTEREWLLNEYGQATFELAITDPHCLESFLQFGNRVLIQSNAGDASGVNLPDWGGVIDPPREWNGGDHSVTVTAYSAEYLFTWRRGPISMTYVDSWGGLFRRVLGYANKSEDLYIREGEIYEGGTVIERTLELHEMYNAITGMIEDSGMEWGLEPALDDYGRLYFLAHWWERRGVVSGYGLQERSNIGADVRLTEQDDIFNNVQAFSSSMAGWNSNQTRTVQDQESIERYGLRSVAKSVSTNGAVNMAAILAAAQAELKDRKQPKRTFELSITSDLPNGNDAVGQIRLGNRYPLYAANFGFYGDGEFGVDTMVRVIGMRWNDANQTLEVNAVEAVE